MIQPNCIFASQISRIAESSDSWPSLMVFSSPIRLHRAQFLYLRPLCNRAGALVPYNKRYPWARALRRRVDNRISIVHAEQQTGKVRTHLEPWDTRLDRVNIWRAV